MAVSGANLPSVEVIEWPPEAVRVEEGVPFVSVMIRTASPVPGGTLLYTIEGLEEGGRARRAEGTTSFELHIPTEGIFAGDKRARAVRIITPMGNREMFLTKTLPRAGLYGGVFTPAVFGGGGLPLELGIETEPPGVSSLDEASKVWLWLPASSTKIMSLPDLGGQHAYLRRPLVRDEESAVWVATFAQSLPLGAYVPGEERSLRRSLRVELSDEDDGILHGAVADRWEGLFERRTADGVVDTGEATVSGGFILTRAGDLPQEGAMDAAADYPKAYAVAPPDLSVCADEVFRRAPDDASEGTAGCIGNGIGSSDAFRRANASQRASCAQAVADRVLEGESLRSMIQALLDPEASKPLGLGFREFIEACASEASPLCVPSPDLRCARALVAHAYRDVEAVGPAMADLADAYDQLTREAFVGRQLAAFHVDTRSRLQWLQSSEAPPFLASTLREYNEQILREWRSGVLEAHLDGIFGQLDDAGLAVLGRSTTDPVALAKRRELLMELSNSWRAAMDALALLTNRWNVLYQAEHQRSAASKEVQEIAFRLYLGAVVVQQLGQELGATYLTSGFGTGFSALMQDAERLSLPFDRLVFSRDAAVVASRSLDPQSDSRSLLGELEESSRQAVADASLSVDIVLDEAQKTAIDEATLSAQYEDQLLALRNELIELCGLPAGCGAIDVGTDASCNIDTSVGRCGYAYTNGSNEISQQQQVGHTQSVSAAGGALLAIRAAVLTREEAKERLRAYAQKTALTGETVEAFAEKVREWDQRRRAVARETDALLAEIASLNNYRINAALAAIYREQAIRQHAYDQQAQSVERWNVIRIEGVERDLRKLGDISGLHTAASALNFGAERLDMMADIVIDGIPNEAGASWDPTFWHRWLVRGLSFGVSTVMGAMGQALDGVASAMEVQLANQQALREAKLSHLADLASLGGMQTELEIAQAEAQFAALELDSQRESSMLQALIDSLHRKLELELAHEKDLQALRDRRDAWRLELVEAMGLEYQSAQTELTVRQKELAYMQIVQQAQLLEGRFQNMRTRWQSLDQLLGSADVLFSFANRMARAEIRLDRARRALEDWLVALEYFAVRPFVNERMAILLARNPAQLEAIANEMARLQMVCGGPVTLETVDVSLRDDLLRLEFTKKGMDGVSTSSPAERFRALLQRQESHAPRGTFYRSGESLGARLERGNIWAVDFHIDLDGFANLSRTCNAKIDSVAIQLVGDDLGRGQPVVSLVHHGSSQLRSCQPGISDYVAQFGSNSTAFAPVTAFQTSGRLVAPLAGISEFGEAQSWNTTLEGIPFSSEYSVLIDLEHPSNKSFDWDRLDDIRLQLRYSYQDVFPKGQCE